MKSNFSTYTRMALAAALAISVAACGASTSSPSTTSTASTDAATSSDTGSATDATSAADTATAEDTASTTDSGTAQDTATTGKVAWSSVKAVVATKCGACHTGFKFDASSCASAAKQAGKFSGTIKNGSMPPPGQPKLTDAEKAQLTQWATDGFICD